MRASSCLLATLVLCASCGSSDPSGAIRDENGLPAGPTRPIPATLWRAPVGSTPAAVTYIYLEADQSFASGVSFPRTIVPNLKTIDVSAAGGLLVVTAKDTASQLEMRGLFSAMIGHTLFDEGYYHDLHGTAEAEPLRGFLEVSLNGQKCASLTGWFAVDQAFYFNGHLTSLDLRFEQRCPGVGAPLRGQIHWTENLT